MADPILHLLSDNKLRALMLDTLTEIYSYAGTIYDNPQDDMKGMEDEELWAEAWERAGILGGDHGVDAAFQKHLFDKMPEPRRVIPAEISDVFWALATPLEYRSPDYDREYAEGVYSAFLRLVCNQILSYRDSAPFVVGRVNETDEGGWVEMPNRVVRLPQGQPDSGSSMIEDLDVVWRANGIELRLAGTSPCTDMIPFWNNRFVYLNMRISGSMSECACQDLADDLARAVSSVIRSLTLIRQLPMWAMGGLWVPSERSLPVVTEKVIQMNASFLRRCLDAYFC